MSVTSNNPTTTNIEDLPIPDSFIQKWAMWLAGGILFGAMLIYAINFNGSLSDQTSSWGEYGDFLGGVVNPIIGFFTIWLLATSLKQNQHALAQARRELVLAREAIEQARDIQKATEESLKAQVQIADQTRDFANAAVLFEAIDEDLLQINKELRNIGHNPGQAGRRETLEQKIRQSRQSKIGLANILNSEVDRLIAKYQQPVGAQEK